MSGCTCGCGKYLFLGWRENCKFGLLLLLLSSINIRSGLCSVPSNIRTGPPEAGASRILHRSTNRVNRSHCGVPEAANQLIPNNVDGFIIGKISSRAFLARVGRFSHFAPSWLVVQLVIYLGDSIAHLCVRPHFDGEARREENPRGTLPLHMYLRHVDEPAVS